MTTMTRTRLLGMAATTLLLLGMAAPGHVTLLNESNVAVRKAKASAFYVASHVELLAGNVNAAVCLQERAARLLSVGDQL